MVMRVALAGGPMYDGLYSLLPTDADVVVHADHPTLNRAVAERWRPGSASTSSPRTRSTPRRRRSGSPHSTSLVDLARLRAPAEPSTCAPIDGALLCVPRNVDVRVMWVRHDRLDDPPLTWEALTPPTRSSASQGASRACSAPSSSMSPRTGGTLFDSDRQPTLDTTHAVEAVDALCRIAHRGPTALPSWHYDDVDAALGAGIVDMARDLARRLRGSPRPAGRSSPVAPSRTSPGPPASARIPGVTGGRCRAPAETCPRRSTPFGGFPRSKPMRSTRRAAPSAPTSMRSLRSRRSMRLTPPAWTSSAPRSPTG